MIFFLASFWLCSNFLFCSSLPDYTLSKAREGTKRKKQAGIKKEKTEEKNAPTRLRHGLLIIDIEC